MSTGDNERQRTNYDDDNTDESNLNNPKSESSNDFSFTKASGSHGDQVFPAGEC
jgi:hypothetical protein